MNDPTPRTGVRLAAVLVSLGSVAAAANDPPPPFAGPDAHPVWARSHGIALDAGQLVGGGPGYRVTFGDAGFEFTPALGQSAERSHPLAFELLSVQRGGVDVPWAKTAPTASAERVRFDHGAFLADYEVGPEGVQQSFTFPEPLPGSGELVVTGRLTTDLLPSGSGSGLRFEAPGLGGLHVGGVTGIAADGARAAGELRLEDDLLQLVLPADFLDRATYPLVLDPLIGNVFVVGSGAEDDTLPAVAYDQTRNLYLVTWKRAYSAVDSDILAQRVSGSPNAPTKLVGGLLFLDTVAATRVDRPVVGNVNQTNRFLVVWEEDVFGVGLDDLKARAVDAATGGVSSILTVANTSAHEHHAAVGGELNTAFGQAMVVWGSDSVGIQAANVRVPSASAPLPEPSLAGSWTISANSNDRAPAITQSGGEAGVHMVVWERVFIGAPGDKDLRARLYDRTGAALSPETPVASSPVENEQAAAVAGDGKHFLVVFEDELAVLSGQRGIMSRPAALDPTLVFGPKSPVSDDQDVDEQGPAVAYTGEAFVATWLRETAGGMELAAASIDPYNGFVAEGPILVSPTTDNANPAVASRFSSWQGSNPPDDALVAWEAHASPGDVHAQYYRTDTGAVTNLGGGCGNAGTAVATSAVEANLGFTQRLLDGPGLSPAFLIVGFDAVAYPCGGCTLVPNPFTSWVFATSTNASGEAAFVTPIPFGTPSLVGLKFYQQWAVSDGSPACSTFSVDLSNANQVEIQ